MEAAAEGEVTWDQWNIYGMSMEYLWNINGISMENLWNISEISEYQWNIYGISMEYLWSMYGMIWNVCEIPTEYDCF